MGSCVRGRSRNCSRGCELLQPGSRSARVPHRRLLPLRRAPLTLGTADALANSETLGRLLLLGLVSGAEVYFRSAIVGTLRVCPVCRMHAANQTIAFGALDYYGVDEIEWGFFEAASLASADEVIRATRRLLGIEIQPNTSVAAALAEFDRLCHLRHAAVHARHSRARERCGPRPRPGFEPCFSPSLHAGASRRWCCMSLGSSCLQQIRLPTNSRAMDSERATRGVWVQDSVIFTPLFNLFHSRVDAAGPANAYQAYRSLAKTLNG